MLSSSHFLVFPYICNVLLLCNFSTFSHFFFCLILPPQLVLFVSLDEELYSTLSLLTQVSKWVPATYSWGVNLRWTTIPLRGSSNTPGRTSCQGNRDKVQPFMPLLLLPLSVVAEYLVWFMHSFFTFFRCWYCIFDMGPCQLAWMSCCIHCLLHCYPLWEHDYFAHSKIWYEHVIIN